VYQILYNSFKKVAVLFIFTTETTDYNRIGCSVKVSRAKALRYLTTEQPILPIKALKIKSI
jgi:hypothetical protein